MYDVLFGIPWNYANNPRIDYVELVVTVNEDCLPMYWNLMEELRSSNVTVTNLSVRTFRKMLKEKSPQDFQLFQIVARE